MRYPTRHKLPVSRAYWENVNFRADELEADGCSGPALDMFYLQACLEHDVHYRTHKWVDHKPISKKEADTVFKWRIQNASPLSVLSPMAQWRYWAVYWAGQDAWDGKVESPVATGCRKRSMDEGR